MNGVSLGCQKGMNNTVKKLALYKRGKITLNSIEVTRLRYSLKSIKSFNNKLEYRLFSLSLHLLGPRWVMDDFNDHSIKYFIKLPYIVARQTGVGEFPVNFIWCKWRRCI